MLQRRAARHLRIFHLLDVAEMAMVGRGIRELPEARARLQLRRMRRMDKRILASDVAWLPLDQAARWWETRPWIRTFSIASGSLIPTLAIV